MLSPLCSLFGCEWPSFLLFACASPPLECGCDCGGCGFDGRGAAFPELVGGTGLGGAELSGCEGGLGAGLAEFIGCAGFGVEFTGFDGDPGLEIELGVGGVAGFGIAFALARPASPFAIPAEGGLGTGRLAEAGAAGDAAVAGDAPLRGDAPLPGDAAVLGDAAVAGDAGVAGLVDTGRMPGCGGRGTLRVGIAGVAGCDCCAFTAGFGAVDEFGVDAGLGTPDTAGVAGDLAGCAAFGIPPRTGCIPGPGCPG